MDIMHKVPVIGQTKTMSCWAAVSAMMLTWKTGIPQTELTAATASGPNFVQAFNANTGLRGVEVAEVAQALNLKIEVPQNYLPTGYYDLLKAHGPLWVGTAIFSADKVYRHVRIVRGISGDGSFNGTLVSVIDPNGGREYTESVAQFAKEMEEIARQDLGSGENLKPQIIRFH